MATKLLFKSYLSCWNCFRVTYWSESLFWVFMEEAFGEVDKWFSSPWIVRRWTAGPV